MATKLPYGIGHFPTVIYDKFAYIDKTRYIEEMENLSPRYFFLLRPRRFGKSLFISMLTYYYDVNQKDNFERLYGDLYIGKHPTPKANAYWVLNFDFSGVDTHSFESTYQGFLAKVRAGVQDFMYKYNFPTQDREDTLANRVPNEMLGNLLGLCKNRADALPVYILIDEYDHFANEILAFRFSEFSTMVSQNGFVRKFYETIKTGAMEGIVGRFFATGVTPLTLDSMTSGFNITIDLSRDVRFNESMGFIYSEVQQLVDLVCADQTCDKARIFADMKSWYNGYIFEIDATHRIYNSDMVLYFLNQLSADRGYPRTLLDKNIASDYSKIARLFKIGNETENLQVLEVLINEEVVHGNITELFNSSIKFTQEDLISLLYYMGFLTLQKPRLSGFYFEMPNYVIKTLYLDFFSAYLSEKIGEDWFDMRSLQEAVLALAIEGNPEPIAKELQSALKKLSGRDAIQFAEKNLKVILVTLLNMSKAYFVKSEYEVEKKFIDVLLLKRPPIEVAYQYAIELKYLPKKDAKKKAAVREEAIKQLNGYLATEEVQKYENLKAFILFFVGETFELIVVR